MSGGHEKGQASCPPLFPRGKDRQAFTGSFFFASV
jgi:hypothetical protein